jgi:protein phosphatase
LVSDIRGNLESLDMVLDDIQAQGMTDVLYLGDIIGSGPHSPESIDRVMQTRKTTLLGNDGLGARFDHDSFNRRSRDRLGAEF